MKSVLFSMALVAATAAAQTAQYSVIDLGALPGGNSSAANYVTDNRLVTGMAAGADNVQQAVFWSGPFRINAGLPGLNSGMYGFNSKGQASVNGESAEKDPNNENFCAWGTGLKCISYLWQRGELIPLATLGGNNATLGNINEKGEIAGAAENSVHDPACPKEISYGGTGPQVLDYEAVIWGPKPGDIRELKPLPGDTVGMALWINDNGQAVGFTGTCANSAIPPLAYGAHAVLWEKDGSVHDLGNLGSKVINIALGANNQGQVTGVSSVNDEAVPGEGTHAFLWTSAAGMKDLGMLPGDGGSVGSMISEAGDVAGASFGEEGPRAVIWRNGVIHDVNDLVVSGAPMFLLWATSINSRGEISGFGATEKGEVHGFLAVPSTAATRRSVPGGAPDDGPRQDRVKRPPFVPFQKGLPRVR